MTKLENGISLDCNKLYIPQDNKCDYCTNRIGDHTKEELWRCLDHLSQAFKQTRKAYQAFERTLTK